VNNVLPNSTHLQSTFGCEADLNTLTACQLKSTFSTKRLTIPVSSTCFGQLFCPKHVELTRVINKPLLLHVVGCLYYLYFIVFF